MYDLKTKHAVLMTLEGKTYLLWIHPDQAKFQSMEVVKPWVLQDLFELAHQNKCTHLWIMPGATPDPDESFKSYNPERWDLSRQNWTNGERKLLKSVVGWRVPGGGQQQIMVIWPHSTRWATASKPGVPGWARKASPHELLITIRYLEQALGIPIGGSASVAGWKLLSQYHPDWLKEVRIEDFTAFHIGPESGGDLIWQQKPIQIPGGDWYLHKFDKGSAYLAAAVDEFYGAGQLVRTKSFDPKRPGVWQVTASNMKSSNLPPVWKNGDFTGWVATPIVRLAIAMGYEVQIHNGWVFERHHQLLAKWAEKLWNARVSFASDEKWKHPIAREYAREAIKQIAVTTVGITSYSGYEEDEQTDKRRGDIKLMTVSRNREIVYHNLVKTQRLDGSLPVMVYMDAMYYLSSNPDGRQAFPSLERRAGKLGGYRYEGAIRCTNETRVILQSQSAVTQKLSQLNRIGWGLWI